MTKHIPSKQASEVLRMHPNTLRKLDKLGLINTTRDENNRRLYDVTSVVTDKRFISIKNMFTQLSKEDKVKLLKQLNELVSE